MALAIGCDYGDEVAVTDNVTAVFHDAGHILGSAIIELRVTDGDATQTLVFSGDIGRNDTPIVRDPTPLTHADHVIIESTYGNREHGPHEAAIDELVTAIGEVAGDEGVLLMPAFAIGRTQEVDLGPRRARPRRTHPAPAALPRLADGVAGHEGLRRAPRDVRRGDRRSSCARASRR